MKTDPKVRQDGTCALRGCERVLPVADDPFCSNACCRAYHGVVFIMDQKKPRSARQISHKPAAHQIPRVIPSAATLRKREAEGKHIRRSAHLT